MVLTGTHEEGGSRYAPPPVQNTCIQCSLLMSALHRIHEPICILVLLGYTLGDLIHSLTLDMFIKQQLRSLQNSRVQRSVYIGLSLDTERRNKCSQSELVVCSTCKTRHRIFKTSHRMFKTSQGMVLKKKSFNQAKRKISKPKILASRPMAAYVNHTPTPQLVTKFL